MVYERTEQLPDTMWWTGAPEISILRWRESFTLLQSYNVTTIHVLAHKITNNLTLPLKNPLSSPGTFYPPQLIELPVQANLKYTCICSNGTEPSNIKQYLNTLPNYICNQLFAQCRIANPGSQACQTCGTLNPTDVQAIPSSTSSAAPSSTAAGTGTATAPSTSPTAGKKSGAGRLEAVAGVIGGAIGLAAIML